MEDEKNLTKIQKSGKKTLLKVFMSKACAVFQNCFLYAKWTWDAIFRGFASPGTQNPSNPINSPIKLDLL